MPLLCQLFSPAGQGPKNRAGHRGNRAGAPSLKSCELDGGGPVPDKFCICPERGGG